MHHKPPAHHLARQRLTRAIVSLPAHLCPKGEPLHERVIFFDAPRVKPAEYLHTLLSHAWHTDVSAWPCDSIYNLQSAAALVEEGVSEDVDARLFEVGWGGPEGVTFADPARVDLFVSPVLKARLLGVLNGLQVGSVERLRSPAESAVVGLPSAILEGEMSAFRRFDECVRDGQGYDVPSEMMKRLAQIGLVRRITAGIYEHTTFGCSVLNGEFRAAPTTKAEPAPEVAA